MSIEFDFVKIIPLLLLVAQMVEHLPAMQETGLDPWVGKIPQRRK